MTPFDVIVIMGGFCGICMVIGGMLLLYKGIITLSQTSKDAAVTVEFKEMVKITTHYPALGLFVIGWVFIITSFIYAKPPTVKPLAIKGRVIADDPTSVSFRVYSGSGYLKPLSGGEINDTLVPQLNTLIIEITAPGYNPPTITRAIDGNDLKKGEALLGEITFHNKVADKPAVVQSNIKPVTEALPPLTESGKF